MNFRQSFPAPAETEGLRAVFCTSADAKKATLEALFCGYNSGVAKTGCSLEEKTD